MAKQLINLGTPNGHDGDTVRDAFNKTNQNFTELYSAIGADVQIPIQTGNSGKYLTTNGTVLSWATVAGSGNTFNQSLNTTDDVAFNSLGTAAISVSQINGTNPGNELVIQANNHNWTFGTNGKLTFPGGKVSMQTSTSYGSIQGSVNTPIIVYSGGTTGQVSLQWTNANPENNVAATAFSGVIVGSGIDGAGDVAIITGAYNPMNGDFDKEWSFKSNGSLTFPDSTVQSTAWTGSSSTLTDGVFTIDSFQVSTQIETWTAGATNMSPTDSISFFGHSSKLFDTSWTISGSGITGQSAITAIDPIMSGMSITGYTVTIAQTISTGLVTGDYVFSNPPSTQGVNITSDLSTWTFGSNGTLTFPNATTQTTAWTGSVSSLVNGSHTVSLGTNGLTTFPTFQTGTESLYLQGTEFGSVNSGVAIAAKNQIILAANVLGNQKNWNFGTEGKLTLPAGTTYEYLNAPLTGHGDGLARLDFTLVTDGVDTQWAAASASPAGSGYNIGDTFTFDAEFLGIPGASVTIEVLTVGVGGGVENLAFTQPPLYPADIYRDSPINLQVGPESNRWTFGATGKLTTPGDIQLGAASYLRFSDSSFQGTAFVGDATRLYGNVNQDVDVIARPLSTVTATTKADTDPLTGQFELSEPFDILAVQAGWEMNTGTEQSPIWTTVIDASLNPGEYWIYLASGFNFQFAPSTAYTFSDPTPVLRTWTFGTDGTLTFPDGTTTTGDTVIAPDVYDIQSIGNTLIQTSANAGAKTWTFGTDGTLAVPGKIKHGINQLDLNEGPGGGNVYLTTTADDSTAVFMTANGIQTYARESVSLYAGTSLGALEAAYNNKVIELNAAFAAESWTGAGYPAGPTSSQALNAAKAMNPLIPDAWITIATELQTAYNTWQNALDNTSVSIGVSSSSWAFKPNGSFAINNNEVHIATNNWGQIAFANANTVVYTQKSNTNLASIRVHATIEGDEDGDTTGLHSQACDMMIVRRVSNLGVSTVDSVVYGVIYTGAGPLATLDAQWNAVTNKIEITATPVSTTNNVFVKVYATEVARGD